MISILLGTQQVGKGLFLTAKEATHISSTNYLQTFCALGHPEPWSSHPWVRVFSHKSPWVSKVPGSEPPWSCFGNCIRLPGLLQQSSKNWVAFNRNLLSHSFGGQKSKIKVSAGLIPSENHEGGRFCSILSPSFW